MARSDEFNMANSKEAKLHSIIYVLEALRVKRETSSKQNEELYMTIYNGQRIEPPSQQS